MIAAHMRNPVPTMLMMIPIVKRMANRTYRPMKSITAPSILKINPTTKPSGQGKNHLISRPVILVDME